MLEQKVAEDKLKAAEEKLPAEKKTPAKDQPEVVVCAFSIACS